MTQMKKLFYLLIFTIAALLAILSYQSTRLVFPQVQLHAEKQFVALGENIDVDFTIYNPFKEPKTYRYSLLYNGTKKYENTVKINPGMTFEFGGHYRARKPGPIEIRGIVYEGEELISDTSYYVTVEG